MSVSSLFNIGLSGLEASEQLLQITGNNVTNAQTPDYTCEQATLSSVPSGVVSTTGTSGNGVQVTDVTRAYNSFINAQVNAENSNLSYWNNYNTAITQVQDIFNEASNAGISPAITTFFNDWQNVSQSPQDDAQRTTLISDANNLSSSISTAATSLKDVSSQLLTSSQTLTAQVNSITAQIASLNQELAGNAGSLDLQDQRDSLLNQLNGIIKVSSYQDPVSGMYSVTLGGTPLVEGVTSYNMSVDTDASDNMHFYVGLAPDVTNVVQGSMSDPDVTSLITGGELASNIDLRNTQIPAYMNQLNAFAVDLADTTNYYQTQGYGLDGSTGTNFFQPLSQIAKYTSVDASAGVFTSPGDTFSTTGGTLAIKLGDNDTSPASVTIAANSTLSEVVNDINAEAGSKVSASVVNLGTSTSPDYRISIQSNPEGNLGNVRIGVVSTGDAAGSGLNLLATGPMVSNGGSGTPGAPGTVVSSVNVTDPTQLVADAQYKIDYNYSGGAGYQEDGTTGIYWRVMESVDGGTWTTINPNTSYNPSDPSSLNQAEVNLTNDSSGLSRTLEFQGISVQVDGSGISSTTNPNGETFDVQLDPNAALDMATTITDPDQVAASTSHFTVNSTNNSVVFSVNGGPDITATIPQGSYSNDPGQPDDISAALTSAIQTAYQNSAGSALPDVLSASFNPNTKQFNISMPSGSDSINILWSNSGSTANQLFGFTGDATVAADSSAVSDNPASVEANATQGLPGDNTNANNIAGLADGDMFGGTTPTDFYMSLVSNIGQDASNASTSKQYHTTLMSELTQQQQQASGVSMDEEASNLVIYQQSYQAAAQMITTANQMLTTLLQMVNPNAT